MKVSVIMPAYNEARFIRQTLTCLAAQTLSRDQFEIVVVDNGSSDATVEIVESFKDTLPVKVVQQLGGCVSTVRNFGAARSTGDILAFLDADCLTKPNWLSRSLELGPGRGIWGAHYTVAADASWVARVWSMYQARELEGEVSFIPASNLFMRRSEFEQLGGFEESIETSEDVELSRRARNAGMSVIALPELAVVHLGTPGSLRQFYQQNRWHGRDVLPLFLANLPSTTNLPVVLLSISTFLFFWLTLLGSVAAVIWRNWYLALVPASLLLLAPLLLTLRRAIASRSTNLLGPLFTLYFVYLLARAAAVKNVLLPGRLIGHRRIQA